MSARTQRVRIAVAMAMDGSIDCCAQGSIHGDDGAVSEAAKIYLAEGQHKPAAVVHWITAELPLPESVTVEAEVEE